MDTRPIATPQELAEHICLLKIALFDLWMKVKGLADSWKEFLPLLEKIEDDDDMDIVLNVLEKWNELTDEMILIGEIAKKWENGQDKAHNFPMDLINLSRGITKN